MSEIIRILGIKQYTWNFVSNNQISTILDLRFKFVTKRLYTQMLSVKAFEYCRVVLLLSVKSGAVWTSSLVELRNHLLKECYLWGRDSKIWLVVWACRQECQPIRLESRLYKERSLKRWFHKSTIIVRRSLVIREFIVTYIANVPENVLTRAWW